MAVRKYGKSMAEGFEKYVYINISVDVKRVLFNIKT
jgi:hypothetical protein